MNNVREYSPRECPELRDRLVADFRHGGDLHEVLRQRSSPGSRLYSQWFNGMNADDEAELWVANLTSSQLYWISTEMLDLALSSSVSLPGDSTFDETLVPSRTGLVFLAQEISVRDGPSGKESTEVSCVHWETTTNGRVLIHFGARVAPRKILLPAGDTALTFGASLDDNEQNTNNAYPNLLSELGRRWMLAFRRVFVALMLLMSSPGVTEERRLTPSPNKKARKRQGNVEDVRLIYLRGSSGHAGTGGGHEYHHRWVVSGHWRSQPYGPERSLRRPVWIRPHVKGPEGAPLLTGDKVRVLS